LHGYWSFADDDDERYRDGIATSVSETDKAIVYKGTGMVARYRKATGMWRVKVTLPGPLEGQTTYVVTGASGACP
jgi:hypothetical protein